MFPGCLAGLYTEDETRINLAALAQWAGAELLLGTVVSMDPEAKTVEYDPSRAERHFSPREEGEEERAPSPSCDELMGHGHVVVGDDAQGLENPPAKDDSVAAASAEPSDGQVAGWPSGEGAAGADSRGPPAATRTVSFDLVVVDIGSTIKGFHDTPGACDHCAATRPLSRLTPYVDAYIARAKAEETHGERKPRVMVIGGGAAGVEVAFCVHGRLERELGKDACPTISLVNASQQLTLCDRGASTARKIQEEFKRRGFCIHNGVKVARIELSESHEPAGDGDALASGVNSLVRHDVYLTDDTVERDIGLTIWATGPAPQDVMPQLGLKLSDRGYMMCRSTLQSVEYDYVLGGGDCIDLTEHPEMPKAGVYAVREVPFLLENVKSLLRAEPGKHPQLKTFVPQDGFLSLLATGDEKAIGSWKGMSMHNSVIWKLKDKIDRDFVDLFDIAKMK
jgi:NADH dehydrogenase FAD-containing subunit